jgi:hypothetical protein
MSRIWDGRRLGRVMKTGVAGRPACVRESLRAERNGVGSPRPCAGLQSGMALVRARDRGAGYFAAWRFSGSERMAGRGSSSRAAASIQARAICRKISRSLSVRPVLAQPRHSSAFSRKSFAESMTKAQLCKNFDRTIMAGVAQAASNFVGNSDHSIFTETEMGIVARLSARG